MTRDEMNERLMGTIFTYAAEQAEVEMLADDPAEDEIDYTFSPEFTEKMNWIFKRERRTDFQTQIGKPVKRAAVFLIAVSVSLTFIALSVEAFRI